jgi:hypothetical protein
MTIFSFCSSVLKNHKGVSFFGHATAGIRTKPPSTGSPLDTPTRPEDPNEKKHVKYPAHIPAVKSQIARTAVHKRFTRLDLL